jgi:hypothetical protein
MGAVFSLTEAIRGYLLLSNTITPVDGCLVLFAGHRINTSICPWSAQEI